MLKINNERSQFSAFLLKLYKLLDDPNNFDIVSWSRDGKSFIIKNKHKFCSQVLPNYFKHKNLDSFIRQVRSFNFNDTYLGSHV